MTEYDKPLVWIQGEVKTPPFSAAARMKAGFLLRRLQKGELVDSKNRVAKCPTPGQCHQLEKTVMNFESMT